MRNGTGFMNAKLSKCKEHNNLEITYKQAFHDFLICNDDEEVNNMRVVGMAGHMDACYVVSLLGLLNPSKGKEDVMEFLSHLCKTKKIDIQACMDSIIGRLLRYSLGLVTPSTLAKFTIDIVFGCCLKSNPMSRWIPTPSRGETQF